MKKLIMTAAVVACASIVTAQVVSQNAVGYVKEATPAGGQFTIVNPSGFGGGDIQDLIVNLADLNSGGAVKGDPASAVAAVDKLHVYAGGGYSTYGLYDSGVDIFWMSSISAGWNKGGSLAVPAVATIERGQSVWFETAASGAASSIVTLGEVPNDGTTSVNLGGTFTLIAYPYSASINLTDLEVTNAVAGGAVKGDPAAALAAVDKLHVYAGGGYTTYGLYDSGVDTFWMSSISAGWNKGGSLAVPTSAVLDLGQGLWYESVNGAKTIGFTQNYNLD